MNRLVRPHYEQLLKAAKIAGTAEACDLYINQARGMVQYALLAEEICGAEFEREIQRQDQIRLTRDVRSMAA